MRIIHDMFSAGGYNRNIAVHALRADRNSRDFKNTSSGSGTCPPRRDRSEKFEAIEGPKLPEGSKVTVLEDVVTTGESSIQAVERLREAGYEVDRVLSVIDRQEGAISAMESAKVELISLFKLEELL